MGSSYFISDFVRVADEEVTVNGTAFKAVINRTSSRYRDLNSLLAKNETIAELFTTAILNVGDKCTTSFNETLTVLEVRSRLLGVNHYLCGIKSLNVMRRTEGYD